MNEKHSKARATKVDSDAETNDARSDPFSKVRGTEIDVGWYKVHQSNAYVAAVYVIFIDSVTMEEHWYMSNSYEHPSTSSPDVKLHFLRQGEVPNDFTGPGYATDQHPDWEYILATCVKKK